MTVDLAAELFRTSVLLAFTLAAPVLLSVLATGLLVGLLQTVTQLQDQTLSFIPKLVVVAFVILFLLPWGLGRLTEYASDLIHGIPGSI
jgi:flagellar biosynthesis protein FliQ